MKLVRTVTVACAAGLLALVCMTIRPASGQDLVQSQPPAYPRLAGEFEALGYSSSTPSQDREMAKLLGDEARLERQAAGLVAEYARTEDEKDRSKIKSRLSAVLEKQFDAQQNRRDLEVARIEAQLKKLRELMRKRSDARQTIIDKRLDQLVREAEGLGWTAPAGPQAVGAGVGANFLRAR